MPQVIVSVNNGVELEGTYKKLKQEIDIVNLDFSGGGRGRQDNDCGNLCFQVSSFPKAKFQVSRTGKIQMSIPDSGVEYTLHDCLEKIEEYLVLTDEEKIFELEPLSDITIDKPSKVSSPKEFYKALKYELSKELFYIDSILEAIDANKKTVVLVDPSENFVRLKRGDIIFLGQWSKKEKKDFLDGFHDSYDFPTGNYDVVAPPWLPEDEPTVALDFE